MIDMGTIPRALLASLIIVGPALAAAGCDGYEPPTTPSPSPSTAPTPAPAPAPGPTPGANASALVGDYAVTLEIGSECSVIPAEARTRKYTARIEGVAGGRNLVTLGGASFLDGLICTLSSGLGCNQFFATEDAGVVQFMLDNVDEWHGGYITEWLSSGTWLEVSGRTSGAFDGSAVDASGTGSVWFCPRPSSYPFPCSNYVYCSSASLRMVFTRK